METEQAAPPSETAPPTGEATKLHETGEEKKRRRRKKKKAKRKQVPEKETRKTTEPAAVDSAKVTRNGGAKTPAQAKTQPKTATQRPELPAPAPKTPTMPGAKAVGVSEEHRGRPAAQQGEHLELYETIRLICSALCTADD
jgi:hypothetical protein